MKINTEHRDERRQINKTPTFADIQKRNLIIIIMFFKERKEYKRVKIEQGQNLISFLLFL